MKSFPSLTAFRKKVELVDEIDQSIRSVILQDKKDHRSKESYPYIPFREDKILYFMFRKLHEGFSRYNRRFSLLDVGAGTGRIVALAKMCGIPARGVEFHAPYVELGREFYELSPEELIVENGFNLKFDFLKEFTVIYTYMPIRNSMRMSALHFHLESQALYGTLFVEMLPAYYPMEHFKLDKKMTLYVEFSDEELDKIDYPFPAAICVNRGYNEYDEKHVD